jgi:very-short-patch-repair endonuclease
MCHFYDHVAITDRILHSGMSSHERLLASIRPGHRGAKAARRSLEAADDRAESPQESRMRLVLHAEGIMVASQVEIKDEFDVTVARADFALVELRIAFEYDGGHHLDRDRARADLDRVRTMER